MRFDIMAQGMTLESTENNTYRRASKEMTLMATYATTHIGQEKGVCTNETASPHRQVSVRNPVRVQSKQIAYYRASAKACNEHSPPSQLLPD